MKKLLSLCLICLVAMSAKAQQSDYVDLGLPSGTLWKAYNDGAHFTYHEAVHFFGDNLPTQEQSRKVHESQLVGEAKKVYSNVTNNIKWRKLWLLKQMYECFGAHLCTFENYFLELECSDEELLNYDFYKVCNENDE